MIITQYIIEAMYKNIIHIQVLIIFLGKALYLICIKEKHLKREAFIGALTVFIHELCHTFGGDKSESFSYALTEALQIVIANVEIVETYKIMWESIAD